MRRLFKFLFCNRALLNLLSDFDRGEPIKVNSGSLLIVAIEVTLIEVQFYQGEPGSPLYLIEVNSGSLLIVAKSWVYAVLYERGREQERKRERKQEKRECV